MTNTLKIDRELLSFKLKKAIAFIDDPAVIPALENFRMEVTDSTNGKLLEIIAANSAMQIKIYCRCDSKTNWSFCVPAALFLGTVNSHQENVMTISQKTEKKIEIKCGKSRSSITLDCLPENFKPIEIRDIHSEMTMHQQMLDKVLKTAKEFINSKDASQAFQTMNIAHIDNKIVFTGATRPLMCRAAVRPISITKWKKSVSIHFDTIKRVISILDEKGEIDITHSDTHVRFYISGDPADSVEIISTIYNGKYPNTEGIFSKRSSTGIVINTLEFMYALKRLKLYANKEAPTFTIDNKLNSQEIYLQSEDVNRGRSSEEALSITNGQEVTISTAYNIKQMTDILSSTDAAEVRLLFDNTRVSFVQPIVNTDEEDVFNFLVGEILAPDPVVTANTNHEF